MSSSLAMANKTVTKRFWQQLTFPFRLEQNFLLEEGLAYYPLD